MLASIRRNGSYVEGEGGAQEAARLGTGVICEARAAPGAVIPAQAGIYSASHGKCAADGLDSRSPPSRGQASRE